MAGKFKHMGSLQIDEAYLAGLGDADFAPANQEEKANFIADRKSISYWADAWRRLRKNVVAMVALVVLIFIGLFAFVGPAIVPYGYDEFNAGAENLHPWHYTLEDQARLAEATQSVSPEEAVAKAQEEAAAQGKTLTSIEIAKIRAQANVSNQVTDEDGNVLSGDELNAYMRAQLGIKARPGGYSVGELERMANGEKVFPHLFGTDRNGRDYMARVMMGTRISMIVGVAAALLVLIIGAVYGSISGYCGGKVDVVMQRIVEIIYSIPEVLVILLISMVMNDTLKEYVNLNRGNPIAQLINLLGSNLIGMFIAFGMLYWVTMSRIIRGQIIQLKEQEYVTAARALGASGGRIIRRHLLPNCMGQIVVTTCLQIPSAIFLESFLSFLGVGVSAPLPSLGSMASDALNGLNTYPYRLFFPAIILSVMILSFNLFGDGLRDALDPRLKK
ncbi:ABC transporter permease [Pseudoflavonifractor sp. 524-17]|uniref:ABC transporter permease n=1 Tax=Pseudoflavonifractor sp. 524-17 TaxID=2304577 RepID=UPI00137B37A9|nr:ABC transporter permease [Pseudoflavonifractor sp. 524-17]NCE65052.1 ABC transporter permease [Pseudoflavonifractor sp. 524-17]